MGHRLSKIYTRTGDDGTTGLTGGERVAKDHPRVEAMGAVDELNNALGVLLTESLSEGIRENLNKVQHKLFDLGGELSMPGHSLVAAADVEDLESALDRYNADLAPLKDFILPGGSRAAALCHAARGICRRAERRVVTLGTHEELSPCARQYLNRLSDLLFVLARVLNRDSGHPDVLWQRD
ncbi:MAG: cob(I)yrinic acid a,c-diamide adenosyltransferase [Gammaproteobacteria bacterium]|nr:cob(I)yrinic acid a,c-diamide adenosyltransferase [Gammaproteobacteria bacterium]